MPRIDPLRCRLRSETGRGNNGTLVNSPTYNSTSGSFTFNGSTQYATTPSQIINVTSSWTTNVWFKTTGSTNLPSLVVRGNVGETLIWACYLQNATGRVQFLMRNSTDQVITGTTSTNDNNWHMATYTNTGGLVTLYLDGNQENSGSITNLSNIANNVVLGRWGDSTGPYYYRGHIGTVQMYNRALSSTEILRNYNTQKSRFGL